ncbi:alpha/beta hydrolase [Sulfurospirillum sp.]|uniref:alpha/beta hydrolase n=1 Tax=Sulfurospirillum sp. TaxID=2053622 RepID=UPI002FDD6C73
MRFFTVLILLAFALFADVSPRVIDIPTRSGVSERLLILSPENPKAVVVLFAGGHGGIQLSSEGKFGWGEGNFLMRTRELFVKQGLMVVIVDAPSDRQHEPYLNGFRQTQEHAQDIAAVISWLKTQTTAPLWLVGTSRGTQSVAYVAIENPTDIHGIVLTSSILYDAKSNAVSEMKLEKLRMPVLVVHHKNDGCSHCSFDLIPSVMHKLTTTASKEMVAIEGGQTKGDPCNAFGYHGYNGVEEEVVSKISEWVVTH